MLSLIDYLKKKLYLLNNYYFLAFVFLYSYISNLFITSINNSLISTLPFLFIFIIYIVFFYDNINKNHFKLLSFFVSFSVFLTSINALYHFDFNDNFQYYTYYYYQNGFVIATSAVDGIAILFIVLTTFTSVLVILCS